MLNLLAVALAACLADAPVDAPVEAGFSLQGQVLDPTRAPIAAASVTAIPAKGGPASITQTDERGAFALRLAPGDYTLKVVAAGFQEAAQSVSATAVGGAAREFLLKVAPFVETITVRGAGSYQVTAISSATRTLTRLLDVPQSVSVATRELIRDQLMMCIGDVVRYMPGIAAHQGENNRDQVIIRGNSSSADFFLDGVRDDVQYYRDLYNLDRVEALKGPNAMVFGRGGGGGVINRVTKEAGFQPFHEVAAQAGGYGHQRLAADLDQPLNDKLAFRLNAMYESSDSFRDYVDLDRFGLNPTLTIAASPRTRITLGY